MRNLGKSLAGPCRETMMKVGCGKTFHHTWRCGEAKDSAGQAERLFRQGVLPESTQSHNRIPGGEIANEKPTLCEREISRPMPMTDVVMQNQWGATRLKWEMSVQKRKVEKGI